MELNLLFYVVASILYLFVGGKIVASFKKRSDSAPLWVLPLIGVAIVAHFWVLQGAIFPQKGHLVMGFGCAVSAMSFISALVLFFGALYSRVHVLFAWVLLVAGLGIWGPMVMPSAEPPMMDTTGTFRLHIAMGIVAYSFMLIAVIQAVLMGMLDARLRSRDAVRDPEGIVASLPNLMDMEKMLFQCIGACFVFLTLTVAGGWMAASGQLAFDHKTVLTLLSWAVFGVLLLGRRLAGWRSRQALRIFWIAVVFQVLAYLAYRFVLDLA